MIALSIYLVNIQFAKLIETIQVNNFYVNKGLLSYLHLQVISQQTTPCSK